jgi:hypothetical protein
MFCIELQYYWRTRRALAMGSPPSIVYFLFPAFTFATPFSVRALFSAEPKPTMYGSVLCSYFHRPTWPELKEPRHMPKLIRQICSRCLQLRHDGRQPT